MLRVGILGAGAIGQTIARAIDEGRVSAALTGLADLDQTKAQSFARTLKNPTPILSLDELIEASDLIIEAASQSVLPELVPKALLQAKDLLIMSVGGLLEHDPWFREARKRGCRIYVPSGAVAGLDGLRAASFGRIDRLTLTSRKPVAALAGAKYVVEHGLRLETLEEDTIIFEGSAAEASRGFPATANIAASLFLASGGSDTLRVQIVVSSARTRNVHEVRAEGDFGCLRITLENVPMETNPCTSKLAALSALATLEGITRTSFVGTSF